MKRKFLSTVFLLCCGFVFTLVGGEDFDSADPELQLKVLLEMKKIPVEVQTEYGDIAEKAASVKAKIDESNTRMVEITQLLAENDSEMAEEKKAQNGTMEQRYKGWIYCCKCHTSDMLNPLSSLSTRSKTCRIKYIPRYTSSEKSARLKAIQDARRPLTTEAGTLSSKLRALQNEYGKYRSEYIKKLSSREKAVRRNIEAAKKGAKK